jgi:hypothetical protein
LGRIWEFTFQSCRSFCYSAVRQIIFWVGKIVTAFVENGLEVSEAATSEESLEDYFKRVTGGEGIA